MVRFSLFLSDTYNSTDKNNNTISVVNSVTNINIGSTKLNKRKNNKAKDLLICPLEKQAPFQLIPTLCRRNRDCKKGGSDMKCCNLFGSKRCVKGVRKSLPEPPHDREYDLFSECRIFYCGTPKSEFFKWPSTTPSIQKY